MSRILLVVVCCSWVQSAAAQSLTAPGSEAALGLDAGTLPDSGSAAVVTAAEDVDAERARQQKIAEWVETSNGLPPHDSLSRILQVDSRDVVSLEGRIRTIDGRLDALVSVTADGGPLPMSDAGVGRTTMPGDGGAASGDLAAPAIREAVRRLRLEKVLLERALTRARSQAERSDELSGLLEAQRIAREAAEKEAKSANAAKEKALEDAKRAQSELLSKLYTRIAKAEGLRAELFAARAFLHRESERDLEGVRQNQVRAEGFWLEVTASNMSSQRADEMFLVVLHEEQRSLSSTLIAMERRRSMRPQSEAIQALTLEIAQDRRAVTPLLATNPDGALREALDRLDQIIAELTRIADEAARDTASRWFALAVQRAEVTRTLDRTRLALLEKLSPTLQSSLRGFTEVAGDNLWVALRHLSLEAKLHVMRRVHDIRSLPTRMSSVVHAGSVLLDVGQALFSLLCAIWVWRRAPKVFARLKDGVMRRSQSAARARVWDRLFRIVATLSPFSFVILVTGIINEVLGDAAPRPEFDVIVEIVIWIAAYKLCATVGNMLVLRLARQRVSLTVHHKLKILRSVRLLMRCSFIVAYVLIATKAMVGQGILYEVMQRLAITSAVPVFVILIQRWRLDIVTAYLKGWPETRLAQIVAEAEQQWYGFFVASAAFAFVSGKALVTLSRDFVLGFDQTRRALAYLFRLRIERRARSQARPVVSVDALPEPVRIAFDDRPRTDGTLIVDRMPGLEAVADRLCGGTAFGAPTLVYGHAGIGRTTWLLELSRRMAGKQPVQLVTPPGRFTEPAALFHWLCEALHVAPVADVPNLAHELSSLPRGVVLLDGVERLFLRKMGGYEALDAFHALTRATRGHIAWVLSCTEPAFRHLQFARRIDEQIASTQRLSSWSEQDIRALIQGRQQESGVAVSFEDLLVQELEGMRESAQVVETEEGYIRLLWNFAEGNPRVAQHFWLKSLIPTSGEVLKVNLYDAPSANDLEPFPSTDRFVLAAFVLHGALTIEHAASTCDLPVGMVEAHLLRGVEHGIYRPTGDEREAYAIDVHWWEAVVRFLRRKKLL